MDPIIDQMMDVALLIKFIGLPDWEFGQAVCVYGTQQNNNYPM